MENSFAGGADQCGQAATLTFYMELLSEEPVTPDPAPPGGTAGGAPFSAVGCCCPQPSDENGKDVTAGPCDYKGIWSYRRAFAPGTAADPTPL